MSHHQLADLDELVLRCHDQKARAYLMEAVASYKGGAMRAAIISTWIGVAFDFIDKVRQLDLQGDTVATKLLADFNGVQTAEDIIRSLAFERQILDKALNDLKLISPSEYDDLVRLYKDRHRCAHPSMNSSGEIFQPTAEQVRYHIRTAVETMLSQPPTSGKAALENLEKQVKSDYFPDKAEKALLVLKKGPLSKARPALVRNFIIVIVKMLLDIKLERSVRLRGAAALNATKTLYPGEWDAAMKEKLSPLLRVIELEPKQYSLVVALIARVNGSSDFLEEDITASLEEYVSKLSPPAIVTTTEFISQIPFLKALLVKRLGELSSNELVAVASRTPAILEFDGMADRIISIYVNAGSYDWANTVATTVLIPLVRTFSKNQIESLLKKSFENNQILGSFEFSSVVEALKENVNVNESWWNPLLEELGASDQFSSYLISHSVTADISPSPIEDVLPDEIPF